MEAIRIGVSACLLGQNVRYDGTSRPNPIVLEILCRDFDCVPICPEMAIGLGSPRPPVELVKMSDGIRAIGRDDPSLDITERINRYAAEAPFGHLSGFVLKSRSPSCAVGSAPLFGNDHQEIKRVNGLFTSQVLESDLSIPVIEDSELGKSDVLDDFIVRVNRRSQLFSRGDLQKK